MRNKRFGIQIKDDGDLSVVGGSLAIGDTLAQNTYLLIVSQPGDLKEHPTLGAAISDFVGSSDVAVAKRKIRDAFKADGLNAKQIELTKEGKISRLEVDYDA